MRPRRRLRLRPWLRLRPRGYLGLRPWLRLWLRPGLDLGLWPRLRLRLRPRLHLGLRARLRLRRRLHPGRCLGLRARLGLDLRLRPRGYLRLWPRLRLSFRPRLHPGWCLGLRARLRLGLYLGLRAHRGLRSGLDLRLGPRLHLGLRAHLGFYLRRCLGPVLRRCLGLRLGLAGGAAGLRGPWSSRGGWRPRPDTRVEFSRFDLTGWRSTGLYLTRFGRGAWLHLSRLGLRARLDLPRLGGYDGLPRSRSARQSGLPRFSRSGRLPRSRLGCGCRGKRLGFTRHKLLLGRQLLNLLGHLRGQGHGGLGGQGRARQAASRLQRRGLDPGNSGGDPRHILGRWYEIGPVQVNPGQFGIWRQLRRRQAAALGQGRRDNLPDISMVVEHPPGRHHTVNPGDVGGVAG